MTNGRRTVNEVTSPSKSSINKTILAFGLRCLKIWSGKQDSLSRCEAMADTRSRAHQGVAQIQLS